MRRKSTIRPQEARPSQEKTSKSFQFKKNVFRYKAVSGHFPKEAESFLFVKRTDPRTRVTKVIPEVVYPIEANRTAVPKHALIEDDWRAYRSVFHNYQTLVRSQTDPGLRLLDYYKSNDVASRIYSNIFKPKRTAQPAVFVPTLAMYKDRVDAPLGYMYRRFKQGNKVSQGDASPRVAVQELKTPVLLLEGPFMDTVYLSHGSRVKAECDKEMEYYDADVIVTGLKKWKTYIYNEPDAIPTSCARIDFSVPLSERAKKVTTSCGTPASDHNVQTLTLPLSNLAPPGPYFPFPDMMTCLFCENC